ncbi:MAG TPA: carboxypeptidase-like regulatory domain-containing protein [Polyangiaceae bacterium]|nr:carboxypeptidase-like regulatory domain-containing protein [Polyangiaceae bacterium]
MKQIGKAVIVILCANAACGDGAETAPMQTATSSGVGGGGGGAPPTAQSLSVRVGIDTPTVGLDAYIKQDIETEAPAVGATVALDAPNGERIELVTGDDGRVMFEDIDWDAGRASVTAHLPGHALASRLGVTEADGEVTLHVRSQKLANNLVKVSGSAVNMTDPAHYLEVSATVENSNWWGDGPAGPDWSIWVPPNEPFTIVAREITYGGGAGSFDNPVYGWVTLDHPAVSSTTTKVELDFANPVAPETVSGSFDIALRRSSPLRFDSFGFVYSATLGSRLTSVVARGTSSQFTADGDRCDYVAEYPALPNVTDPVTLYRILHFPNRFFAANVLVAGYPGGNNVPPFIDLPHITSPENTGLHEPVSWVAFDSGVYAQFQLLRETELVWTIETALDDTTLTVPAPPSTIDPAALSTTPLEGQLYLIADDPGTAYIDKRTGPAESVFLTP